MSFLMADCGLPDLPVDFLDSRDLTLLEFGSAALPQPGSRQLLGAGGCKQFPFSIYCYFWSLDVNVYFPCCRLQLPSAKDYILEMGSSQPFKSSREENLCYISLFNHRGALSLLQANMCPDNIATLFLDEGRDWHFSQLTHWNGLILEHSVPDSGKGGQLEEVGVGEHCIRVDAIGGAGSNDLITASE